MTYIEVHYLLSVSDVRRDRWNHSHPTMKYNYLCTGLVSNRRHPKYVQTCSNLYGLLQYYRKCVYIRNKCAESHSAFHFNFFDVVDCKVLWGQTRFYIGSEWTATVANIHNHSLGGGEANSNYNVPFPFTFPNLIAAMFASSSQQLSFLSDNYQLYHYGHSSRHSMFFLCKTCH